MSLIKWQKRQSDPVKYFTDGEYPFLGLSLFPFAERDALQNRDYWSPAIDVAEDENSVTVRADLPGLKKNDINLSLDKDVLSIRGEKRSENEEKNKNYHRVERFYGSFERHITLPSTVDETQIKAEYKDGVLSILLPKRIKDESKQIEIK
jgi:HSP20 family protein